MSRLRTAAGALTALGLSTAGFIAAWEGLETKAYPDPATRGEPWTICYGDTLRPDRTRVRPGDTDTVEGCKRRLVTRMVNEFEPGVVACIGKEAAAAAPGGLYLSMIEGAWNYGVPTFCKSTAADRARARDWRGACQALTWYTKANGKVMKGLQNRRQAAFEVCIGDLKGVQPKTLTRSRSALDVDAIATKTPAAKPEPEPAPAKPAKKTCFFGWCW